MGRSKVVYGGETLIDLTADTVNANSLLSGVTAHDRSGEQIIGEYDVPSGSQTVTANGTYDVTALAEMIVNVSGGGGSGLEFESGTFTPTSDVARPQISFSKTHSETPIAVIMADATGTNNTVTNSNMLFVFFDPYRAFGVGFPYSSSAMRFAAAYYGYRGSSSTSITVSGALITHNSDDTGASSTAYSRNWATESGFHPYTGSNSRYWRSGRTYKWYAVWKSAA